MAGYDENVLERMFAVSRRSPNNLVLVDGQDMITIFEGRIRVIIAARFRGPCPEQASPQETRAVLAAWAAAGT
jgi:hypothetical protein